jgi:hypothetical protein
VRDLDLRKSFVAVLWAAATLALLGYVRRFGSSVPIWDDARFIAAFSSGDSLLPGAVFEQTTAHRIPLLRVAMNAAQRVTGDAFRAVPYATVLLISLATVLVVVALWRRRGRAEYTDAAIPLALLSLGPAVSIVRSVLLTGGLFAVGTMGAVGVLLRKRGEPARLRSIALVAACALLALTGSWGVIVVSPLLLALLGRGLWRRLRERAGSMVPDDGPVALAVYALTLVYCLWTVVAFRSPDGHALAAAPLDIGRTALQALGQALGPAGAAGWTETGFGSLPVPVPSLLCAALLVTTLVLLARPPRRLPGAARLRLGLFALTAGLALLAGAIGVGRAALGERFGLQNHYALFFSALVPLAYVTADVTLRTRSRRAAQMCLFALVGGLYLFNAQIAFRQGKERVARMDALHADVRSGAAIEEYAADHAPFLHADAALVTRMLRELQAAGLPPFDGR